MSVSHRSAVSRFCLPYLRQICRLQRLLFLVFVTTFPRNGSGLPVQGHPLPECDPKISGKSPTNGANHQGLGNLPFSTATFPQSETSHRELQRLNESLTRREGRIETAVTCTIFKPPCTVVIEEIQHWTGDSVVAGSGSWLWSGAGA